MDKTVDTAQPSVYMSDEIFDVFDENGVFLGREKRGIVHQKGLLHKSVHTYIFGEKNGQLLFLIQKRAATKHVHPNRWDISVAEHLQPGEDFLQGAVRGAQEELGLKLLEADLNLIEPMHKQEAHIEEIGVHDIEFCEGYYTFFENVDSLKFELQESEVSEIKFVPVETIFNEKTYEAYTAWFVENIPYVKKAAKELQDRN